MTTIPTPGELFGEFDGLLARAEAIRVALDQALEDAERHSRSLTDAEIASLATLSGALARLQRATANGNGAASEAAVEALHAWLGESAQLVAPLRDRFAALGMVAPAVVPAAPGTNGTAVAAGRAPAGATGRPSPTPADPVARRTLMLVDPVQTGADVEHFQRLLNFRFEAWHAAKRVAESGVYDAETRRAAWEVARRLGIADEELKNGFTPETRDLIRHPDRRSAEQLARAKRRRQTKPTPTPAPTPPRASRRRSSPVGASAPRSTPRAGATARSSPARRRASACRRRSCVPWSSRRARSATSSATTR